GYTILDAGEVTRALTICNQHPGPIHLLITDALALEARVPDPADRFTSKRPEMKTLYLSHHELKPDTNFLLKPIRIVDLLRKVREVLDQGPKPARHSLSGE